MKLTHSDIKQIASCVTDSAISEAQACLAKRGQSLDPKTEATLRTTLDKLIETCLFQRVERDAITSTQRYQHTPPPWKILEGNGQARGQSWVGVTTINQDVSRRICTIENGKNWSAEYWANVQLIAASPQLLEILDAILPTLPSSWIEQHSELYEQAIAAVDAVLAKEDR